MAKKVLLHTCCGVCVYACIKRLKREGFIPVVFFFNPNIQPQIEYQKRRDAASIVAEALDVQMLEGEYQPSNWYKGLGPYGQEAEGGRRCLLCYRLRLEESFKMSVKEDCDYFTTTLSISPHKISSVIIGIGKDISRNNFLPFDFKKGDGFKKSVDAVKEFNLYRQNYCGCTYSLRDRSNG